MRCLKSFLRKVNEGLLVILQIDKSRKFAVMSEDDYLAAGKVNTDKDECVGEDFVRETQRILNGHCSVLMKIFNTGSNWSHESRHREA